MKYGLRPDEPLAAGVGKVACRQIDQAIGELSSARDPHRSVHEARKCMKRVRALLHLIRPAIGEKVFKKEDKRIRDIGRRLSAPRDCQAIIETIEKLENGSGSTWDTAATQSLRAKLYSERRQAERELHKHALEDALADLVATRDHYRHMKLHGGDRRIADGLQRSYRQARHDFKRAYTRERSQDFHEWRKSAQRHWRQMQLLRGAWPEALDARVTAARELSRLLGDDHDLTVLMDRVAAQKESLGAGWNMSAFLAACATRQNELRRSARDLGKFLFVERPGNFRRRIDAYWRAARGVAKAANGSGAKAQQQAQAVPSEPNAIGEPLRPGAT
jgi:CHAD domain-containing protein